MNLLLSNKNVLVTGSSKGIGYAIAQAFLNEGAKVIITGRNQESLNKAEKSLEKIGEVISYCGDMTSSPEIDRAIVMAEKKFGGIDVVIANVGEGSARGVEISHEEWHSALQTNFVGAMILASKIIPSLIERKGNIIFISSIAGVESVGASIPYSASKAALLSTMKGLSHELGPKGVRVNAIAPGNILFSGGRWEKRLLERKEVFENYINTEVPLKRFGTPEEIANTALFLASPLSAFTTGACFVVDGGQTNSY